MSMIWFKRYKIAVDAPLDSLYHYISNIPLEIGDLVDVPFGKSIRQGIVFEIDITDTQEGYKDVISKRPISFSKNSLDFIRSFADYNIIPIGLTLRIMLSKEILKISDYQVQTQNGHFVFPNLSDEQNEVYQDMINNLDSAFSVSLLDGVTGSGKTELYSRIVLEKIKNDGQGLIMLPEILLASTFITRLENIFGKNVYLWHSGISSAKKKRL